MSSMSSMTQAQWADAEHLALQLCANVGLNGNYCDRIDVTLDSITFHLFKGRDGQCTGAKYVDLETGEAARETVQYMRPDMALDDGDEITD